MSGTPSKLERVFNLLALRDELRSLFSHINLAGGPNHVHSSTKARMANLITKLGGTYFETPQDLQRAFAFYSVESSASQSGSNRYGNIWAFDRTAVTVPRRRQQQQRDGGGGHQRGVEEEEDVYLNANVVVDGKGSWWVASQAPTPTTFNTFFNALLNRSATKTFEHVFTPHHPENDARLTTTTTTTTKPRVAVIVQLTGWFEGKTPKADNYLPKQGSPTTWHCPSSHLAPVKLTLSESIDDPSLCSLRSTIRIEAVESVESVDSSSSTHMTIHHFLYHAWPDHGVPQEQSETEGLIALVKTVGEMQREYECEVWVHCSAGIGRTGTFIALSSLVNPTMRFATPVAESTRGGGERTDVSLTALGALPKWAQGDSVLETVDLLRESRGMMVQSQSQLGLIYDLTGREPAE